MANSRDRTIGTFPGVTDDDLARARIDPAFRQKLLTESLETLLAKMQKLRKAAQSALSPGDSQLREGVELAVRLAALNPGATLPNLPIIVVHRADGSGTTYIFTDYLSHISSQWKSQIGTSKSVTWPAASSVGMKGNEGVAGQIQNTPGAIGYIELAYALENDIAYAAMQNSAGKFVLPSLDSVRAAAAQKPPKYCSTA